MARLGGDEFVIIQAGANRQDAADLAQRLIQSLASPFDLDGHRGQIGVSVGIALATGGEDLAATLQCAADDALYEAKAAGRGVFRFADACLDRQRSVAMRRSRVA